eukprot:TRINITY_DN791_c0_g1_i2.p1 TRINITY_DN791_c0_g1~~TRINITY_DN791_c0_g1_i2.p1  ORF type:complete len:110 (+),score=10.36 TRINITY_DN791_c0_g1_i2:461-790(+)
MTTNLFQGKTKNGAYFKGKSVKRVLLMFTNPPRRTIEDIRARLPGHIPIDSIIEGDEPLNPYCILIMENKEHTEDLIRWGFTNLDKDSEIYYHNANNCKDSSRVLNNPN